MMTPLHLPSSLARLIEEEAVRAYPDECCGILFGRDEATEAGERRRALNRVEPAPNVFDPTQRARRFLIDPLALMRAERDAADAGVAVVGFYHSHPDRPARPSAYDREHAWPFYSYVIVSVHAREAVDLTSWVLDDATRSFRRQDVVELAAELAEGALRDRR